MRQCGKFSQHKAYQDHSKILQTQQQMLQVGSFGYKCDVVMLALAWASNILVLQPVLHVAMTK